jgi:hypothetical protein
MIKRKPSPTRIDQHWFVFASNLLRHATSDYIALRVLSATERLVTFPTCAVLALDIAEKALKMHLAVRTESKTALSEMRSNFGHNIEAIRHKAAAFEPTFAEPDILAFTKDLNDKDGKLYQALRYGSQETTEGWSIDLAKLLPVVDKIFCKSILQLPTDRRKLLFGHSVLRYLLTGSPIAQSTNPAYLLAVLSQGNPYISELLGIAIAQADEDRAFLEDLARFEEAAAANLGDGVGVAPSPRTVKD